MVCGLALIAMLMLGAEGPSTNAPAPSPAKRVVFEIRDARISNPDWRARLLPVLRPIARQEAAAVWAVDEAGLKSFLDECASDRRSNVVPAPRMVAPIGEPVRMSSETTHRYVASLRRQSDGRANRMELVPVMDQVHSGVRVSILSSHLKGTALIGKVLIEENRLLGFHDAKYTEVSKPGQASDRDVARASILGRRQAAPSSPASVSRTIQVPEVDSRRAEGEWLIPSRGALLVSLGPRNGRDKGHGNHHYEERVIAITALPPSPSSAVASPSSKGDSSKPR